MDTATKGIPPAHEVGEGPGVRARCGAATVSGHPCHYPAACCPLHATRSPSSLPPPPSSPRPEPYTLSRLALERAVAGQASPLHAFRLVRAVQALQTLKSPEDEEHALKLVELHGRLMYGQPPHNPEMWALARERFTDEAIGEFVRWARMHGTPYPEEFACLCPPPFVPPEYDDA